MIDIAGFTLPWGIVVVGICSGFAYGLLGVGLVLVHRSSRFINFAHSQIGAFGAALMAILVINGHLPYWVALPLGMTAAAGIGSLVEVSVVRRLARAPRLMSMVATLGVGQFLFFVSLVMNAQATSASFFPVPTGMPTFTVSGLLIGQDATGILILGPLSVLALTLFFRRSRYGLAIRGAAANPDAAAMAGMSPRRLTNMSWAIAGALACMTAALLIPSLGALAGAALGPTLLLRALVAAVIGRMRGLAATFFAGMAIGLLDRVVMYKQPSKAGLSDVILLGAVLVSLLLQGRPGRREEEKGAWLAVRPWPALPEPMHGVWLIRHLGLVVAVPALAVALVVPTFLTAAHASVLAQFGALVVVGLSLSIITGLGGQLSLGQFAIGGAGAAAAIATSGHGSVLLPLLVGTVVGAVVSVVIGIPALRVHGLLFAVATLAFALAMRGFILKQPGPFGFGQSTLTTGRTLLGHPIDDGHVQAYLAIAAVGLALLVARNVFASSFGRLLVALRDNEDAARAFTVSPPRRKLQAYAVAGAFAGLGGSLFAFTQTVVSAGTFAADTSIVVTVIVVVGGTGLVAGPLLGAALAYPTLINVDPAISGTITLAWLLLILYHPNGIPGLLRPVRDRLVDAVARMAGVDPEAARAGADPARAVSGPPTTRLAAATPRAAAASVDGPLLVATGLQKSYGGLRAVNGVDLTVQRGEVLGLVGPNGAGKTTLFECLSGFVGIDHGSITFDGSDITDWSPERRARAGLIRSFQDSALFATLTVLETTMVAAEGAHPTRIGAAIGGWSRADRLREARARELLDLFGLDRYRHTEVGALSTGTRRIAELACLVSLEPKLLLLDEPSSGVAQAEVEAMGQVLVNVRRHLDATLVIIEHDIPLISSIADRMVALETGSVLAIGTPREVLDDPAVVESYLGGDPTAVHRSAAPAPALVTTSSSPSGLGA